MKEVIVIRHGEKSDDELTQEGIVACEALAKRIGPLRLVFASERNRSIQTAEIISGKPAQTDPRANVPAFPDSELEELFATQKSHPLGIIGAIWQKPSLINAARIAGGKLLNLVEEIMGNLADGERALVVSHDGTMIGLEKLLKAESFDTVDHSFGPLEGIRIDEHHNVKALT